MPFIIANVNRKFSTGSAGNGTVDSRRDALSTPRYVHNAENMPPWNNVATANIPSVIGGDKMEDPKFLLRGDFRKRNQR